LQTISILHLAVDPVNTLAIGKKKRRINVHAEDSEVEEQDHVGEIFVNRPDMVPKGMMRTFPSSLRITRRIQQKRLVKTLPIVPEMIGVIVSEAGDVGILALLANDGTTERKRMEAKIEIGILEDAEVRFVAEEEEGADGMNFLIGIVIQIDVRVGHHWRSLIILPITVPKLGKSGNGKNELIGIGSRRGLLKNK